MEVKLVLCNFVSVTYYESLCAKRFVIYVCSVMSEFVLMASKIVFCILSACWGMVCGVSPS